MKQYCIIYENSTTEYVLCNHFLMLIIMQKSAGDCPSHGYYQTLEFDDIYLRKIVGCLSHVRKKKKKSEQTTYHRRAVCPAEVILKHLIVESDPLVVMSKACDSRMKHCLKAGRAPYSVIQATLMKEGRHFVSMHHRRVVKFPDCLVAFLFIKRSI